MYKLSHAKKKQNSIYRTLSIQKHIWGLHHYLEVVVNTNSQILQVMMKDGTRITFNPSVHDVKSKFRILWLCFFIHPYYMNENKLALKLLL